MQKILCLFCLLTVAGFAKAQDILTATPVTYLLTTELTKGTEITTSYLPPKRYGLSRLPNWFATKGEKLTITKAKQARVAITLSALWPQDPLFNYARQGNIKLIEIDASQAITPRAQGVASIVDKQGENSLYAWLNPNNLITMAAIISDDLQRIWPEDKQKIEQNQQQFMLKVRNLINQQQQFLFDKQIDSVILLSDKLEDFAASNQLLVVDRLTKPELHWSSEDKHKLQQQVKADETIWIVTSSRRSQQLKNILPNFEQILVVDSVERWGKGFEQELPLQRWLLTH